MQTLITGGTIVSMDPAVGELDRGDVLIEDEKIVDVAARIDAPGAQVIDATDRIVMPGFVDSHRHTWQTAFRGVGADWTFNDYLVGVHQTLKPHYLPEDVHLSTLFGRLEALHSGVTTMLDWFHCAQSPEHADAAVTALREAPGRSIFCYGAGWGGTGPIDQEVRRIRSQLPGDGLVTMALGLRGPQLTGLDTVATDVQLAVELGLRSSVHIDVDPSGRRSIAELQERGLLRDTMTIVHANGVADDELRMLADAGCSVAISPDVELKMGFGWPETGRMLAAGLRPTLSVDDCPAAAGDLFSTMRTALAVQRGLDGTLHARDVLELCTLDAAEACGLGARTGSITPGKDADLVLLRADDPTVFPLNNPIGTIVASGHPGLVDTVLVAGRVVKSGGALLDVDLPGLGARLVRSRDRIAAAAGIRLDGSWRPGSQDGSL
ncbi:MAG: 5-methylthioadenosine/S-adenosylhomocysteine deaminase [Nocardioidaceae bacterium]|nr:5-methylthioadenosine/S-adenosylhomocysteine deaminase [Nocardioidaceae bacterium]